MCRLALTANSNLMATISIEVFTILTLFLNSIETWVPDIKPRFNFNTEIKNLPNFFGNSTDYFKILDQDDTTILIGARNAVYNLSLNGLRENYKQRIEWMSSDADRELCALKGKQEQDCQNYIRVFARTGDSQIMICGTNSFKPRCRYYNIHNNNNNNNGLNNSFELVREVEAQGRCPYNPQHNSTYIYTDGQLYSATVADFSGADPLIYRETLRTEQYDLKQLNQPAFVSTLERNGYVFFFFREIAMEYMNCGKSIYSRVGRVCKNDRGGPHPFSDRWTSFLKTRLNCSVPGEYPFYFDEIQATSQIIDGIYKNNGSRNSIVYAVFTTSINAIPGSAICAFSIDDILDAFEGRFKYQKDSSSNWLPVSKNTVPDPQPGKCVDDSRTLSSSSANFIKTHTLMESAVTPFFGKPLLTRVSLNYRLTAITVDPQIQAMDGNTYDIIFAGTDNGKIIKFINIIGLNDETQTVVIAELEALPKNIAIQELSVSHKTQSLIVIGDGHIVSIPLHHCSQIFHCSNCLNVQDPYCGWDISNFECKAITASKIQLNAENFIQTINGTENSRNVCKKYGGRGNDINQNHHPLVSQATRGTGTNNGKSTGATITLMGEGRSAHVGKDNMGDTEKDNGNKITLTSINPEYIDNSINDPLIREDQFDGIEGGKINYASSSLSWTVIGSIIIVIVFAIGIFVGWNASRRLCKSSAFHTEHRNQLNSKTRPLNHRNSGKDINLLMNANTFTAPCNNKKDNIEHEFVGEKDRSHECKNSTENLEKEVHCTKTGTLTKVKRTYI